MRILFLSCHSVLEYLELRLLTEMEYEKSIEVFSLGAYTNPLQEADFMRGVIPQGKLYPDLYQVAMQCDQSDIHDELLAWADVVLMMHNSAIPGQKEQQRWLVRNWAKFEKYKVTVIWRSIGQSTPDIEKELAVYRAKGLKIVRYSPLEKNLPSFAGEDAMIRFYQDETELKGWSGDKLRVATIAQSFKKRSSHLGYDVFHRATEGMFRIVFGTDNDDIMDINGGKRTYAELKQDLRETRVFFYYGTVPAPYTLSLMEAMMTGVPVVAAGVPLRKHKNYPWQQYEINDIIKNGVNGYVGDTIDDMRGYLQLMLDDIEKAQRISDAGRQTAIELWGKKGRMQEWAKFFKTL